MLSMQPVSRVQLSESVYQDCLAHALMTEREEVMGLLLGASSIEADVAQVKVWSSMTLLRSDKRPDRCEISPEQLVEAAQAAETISAETGVVTRVVGWYHSHPHITALPSHVDLRTQSQYQAMEATFVGLIFGVFNAGLDPGTQLIEVAAFRAVESPSNAPELVGVRVGVEVVPLPLLLPESKLEEKSEFLVRMRKAFTEAARLSLEELRQIPEESASGTSCSSVLISAAAEAQRGERLLSLLSDEVMPLQQHYGYASQNAAVLADLYRRHSNSAWKFPAPPIADQPRRVRRRTAEMATFLPGKCGCGEGGGGCSNCPPPGEDLSSLSLGQRGEAQGEAAAQEPEVLKDSQKHSAIDVPDADEDLPVSALTGAQVGHNDIEKFKEIIGKKCCARVQKPPHERCKMHRIPNSEFCMQHDKLVKTRGTSAVTHFLEPAPEDANVKAHGLSVYEQLDGATIYQDAAKQAWLVRSEKLKSSKEFPWSRGGEEQSLTDAQMWLHTQDKAEDVEAPQVAAKTRA